jgi:hypothetical protein
VVSDKDLSLLNSDGYLCTTIQCRFVQMDVAASSSWFEGGAGSPVAAVSVPAEDGRRRRPPAGPALKGCRESCHDQRNRTDMADRDTGKLAALEQLR